MTYGTTVSVRTNIKTPGRGGDLMNRPYAASGTYVDMTQTVTQAHAHSQVTMPHSIFSKPYLADDYGDMEYAYSPWYRDAAASEEDHDEPVWEFEYPDWAEPVYEEGEEPEGETVPVDSTVWGTAPTDSDHVVHSAYSWDTVHDAATGTVVGTGPDDGTVSVNTAEVGANRIIFRTFLTFDLTAILGTVTSVELEGSFTQDYLTVGSATFGVSESGHTWPVATADFDEFQSTSFGTFTDPSGVETIALNSAGVDYINSKAGDFAKLCIRENTFDVTDVDPTSVYPGQNMQALIHFPIDDTGQGAGDIHLNITADVPV